MNFINALLCKVWGHKRGKLVTSVIDAATNRRSAVYSCDRCNARWTRTHKVNVKPVPNIPASIRRES